MHVPFHFACQLRHLDPLPYDPCYCSTWCLVRAIMQLRQAGKKVVISMGDVAASGGMFIAVSEYVSDEVTLPAGPACCRPVGQPQCLLYVWPEYTWGSAWVVCRW
jgi:hypothetical protein